MMTTMPGIISKKPKAPLAKGLQPPKQTDFANKKPMLKLNKPAPMLGRNIKKK